MQNLKFTLTLVLFFTQVTLGLSQQNTNFENWSDKGQYEDPDNWKTFNMFSGLGGNISCFRLNGQTNLSNALGLTAAKIPNIDTLQGIILQSGKVTDLYKSFEVLFQYNGKTTDSASISVFYFKNFISQANVVGSGLLYFQPSSNWTKTSLDINWDNTIAADSFTIMISSSRKNLNDTLIIDYINFSKYKLELDNPQNLQTNIFYNLNNKQLVFPNNSKSANIKIYNSQGQLILSEKFVSETFDLSSLTSGLYHYYIELDSGQTTTNKIVIPFN